MNTHAPRIPPPVIFEGSWRLVEQGMMIDVIQAWEEENAAFLGAEGGRTVREAPWVGTCVDLRAGKRLFMLQRRGVEPVLRANDCRRLRDFLRWLSDDLRHGRLLR